MRMVGEKNGVKSRQLAMIIDSYEAAPAMAAGGGVVGDSIC